MSALGAMAPLDAKRRLAFLNGALHVLDALRHCRRSVADEIEYRALRREAEDERQQLLDVTRPGASEPKRPSRCNGGELTDADVPRIAAAIAPMYAEDSEVRWVLERAAEVLGRASAVSRVADPIPATGEAERWCVIFKRDTDPIDYTEGTPAEMLERYERLAIQWTGVVLCKVLVPDANSVPGGEARARFSALRSAHKVDLASLRERVEAAERDTARIEWIRENATSVSDGYGPDGEMMPLHTSTHGRVRLLDVTLPTVPRETQDWTRAALDRAIAGEADAFHAHLDRCERCRTQPMNLCADGAALLAAAATGS